MQKGLKSGAIWSRAKALQVEGSLLLREALIVLGMLLLLGGIFCHVLHPLLALRQMDLTDLLQLLGI